MITEGSIVVYENNVVDASKIIQCSVFVNKFNYTLNNNFSFSNYSFNCNSHEDALKVMNSVFEIMKKRNS